VQLLVALPDGFGRCGHDGFKSYSLLRRQKDGT
jgi:hypothetical protein